MTIENFLSFWSHHNTAIIEGLVALIIISSLYLAFRSLFAKRGGDGDFAGAHVEVDTSKIEKTLQKILDNQAKSAKAGQTGKPAKAKAASAEDMGMDINLDDMDSSAADFEQMANQSAAPLMEPSSAAVAESPAEIAQLKLTLAESQAKIEELQAQLAGQSSAGAGAGLSAQEKEAFQNQIQDLEARLAEYEIISEDIADLSKYREENEQLKLELSQALAKSGTGAAVASTPAPEPVETPAPSLPAEEPPAYNEGAPASEENNAELIDEELMKEFAAAVEGQKAAAAAAKEAPTTPAPVDTSGADDAEKLMSEFENFVSKKS